MSMFLRAQSELLAELLELPAMIRLNSYSSFYDGSLPHVLHNDLLVIAHTPAYVRCRESRQRPSITSSALRLLGRFRLSILVRLGWPVRGESGAYAA